MNHIQLTLKDSKDKVSPEYFSYPTDKEALEMFNHFKELRNEKRVLSIKGKGDFLVVGKIIFILED